MFAKVFSQIFDSSIAENYSTRHVFVDLLVMADSKGVVDMTMDAISRRTNVPSDIVRKAVMELMEPDPFSRSKEEEGRRIVLIDSHRDWGWQIVNYEHYRELRDEEARKAYFRDYKREYRAALKGKKRKSKTIVGQSTPCPTLSNSVQLCPTMSTQGEGEGEGVPPPSPSKEGNRTSAANGFEQFYELYPRKKDRSVACEAWKKHKPPLDRCLFALEQDCKSEQWQDAKSIPYPSTWINKHRWEDYNENNMDDPKIELLPWEESL